MFSGRPVLAVALLLCIWQQAILPANAQLWLQQVTYSNAQCSGTYDFAQYFPLNTCLTNPYGSPVMYTCQIGVPVTQTYQGSTCTGSYTSVRFDLLSKQILT